MKLDMKMDATENVMNRLLQRQEKIPSIIVIIVKAMLMVIIWSGFINYSYKKGNAVGLMWQRGMRNFQIRIQIQLQFVHSCLCRGYKRLRLTREVFRSNSFLSRIMEVFL